MVEAELPGRLTNLRTVQTIARRYVLAGASVTGCRVLEVGCGPGLGLGYLLEKGASRVLGADITSDFLATAHRLYGATVPLAQLDAHHLPFRDETFDAVLLFEVILYLRDPDLALLECRRILAPGGVVMVSLPNKSVSGFRPNTLPFAYYSSEQLRALLCDAGFVAHVYGSFEVSSGTAYAASRRLAWKCGSRLLDIVQPLPKGPALRSLVHRKIQKKTLSIPTQITVAHERDVVNVRVDEIPPEADDRSHRVLYGIGHVVPPT